MIKKFIITPNKTIKKAMQLINKNSCRCLVVVNDSKKMLGTLSDGDIRNALLKKNNLSSKIFSFYNKNSKFFFRNKYSKEKIKNLLKNKNYDIIPILNKDRTIFDIIYKDKTFENNKIKKKKIECSCCGYGWR